MAKKVATKSKTSTAKQKTGKIAAKANSKTKASKSSQKSVSKKGTVAMSDSQTSAASQLFEAKIKEQTDWRGKTLGEIRAIVKKADPDIIEELKWRGVPVWSDHGIICTGETYKSVVKMTFMNGAKLKDPKKLFNSSLEGNTRRAIDFKEGEKIDEKALAALIQEAVKLNKAKSK